MDDSARAAARAHRMLGALDELLAPHLDRLLNDPLVHALAHIAGQARIDLTCRQQGSGDVQGECVLPVGHDGPHGDGIAWWDASGVEVEAPARPSVINVEVVHGSVPPAGFGAGLAAGFAEGVASERRRRR